MTDRTAPAKEASVVTDELIAEALASPDHDCGLNRYTIRSLLTELQSRRSSPVREGEGGLPDLSRGEVAPSMGSLTPDGYKPAPAYRPDPPRSQMAQSNDHARSGSPSLSPSEPSGRGESGGIQGPASDVVQNKDLEDARRWRALMGSGRLHFMGCAGFKFSTKAIKEAEIDASAPHLHFGMEFWNDALPEADRASFPDDFERRFMFAYVDEMVRRTVGSAPPSDESGSIAPSSSDRVDEATMAWAADAAAKLDPNAPRRPYAEFRESLRASDRDAVIEEVAKFLEGPCPGLVYERRMNIYEAVTNVRSLKAGKHES